MDDFLAAQAAYQKRIRKHSVGSFRSVPGWTVEDMEQEMLAVLWKCVNTYKPGCERKHPKTGASCRFEAGHDGKHAKGTRACFNTYFWQCARNRTVDLITAAQREKRLSEWFALPEGAKNPSGDVNDYNQNDRLDVLAAEAGYAEADLEEWYLLKETVIERFSALTPSQQKRIFVA